MEGAGLGRGNATRGAKGQQASAVVSNEVEAPAGAKAYGKDKGKLMALKGKIKGKMLEKGLKGKDGTKGEPKGTPTVAPTADDAAGRGKGAAVSLPGSTGVSASRSPAETVESCLFD